MQKFVSLSCVIAAAFALPAMSDTDAKPGVAITVTYEGIPASKGHLITGLCADEKSYEVYDCENAMLEAKAGSLTHTFLDVKPGTYAVTALHDQNDNFKMDFKFWGPPKEKWGNSRNPLPRMGPALWKDIVFTVGDEDISMTVQMQ